MKRTMLIVFVLLLLAAVPLSVFIVMKNQELRNKAAPATTLQLSPSTLSPSVGDEFTLEIKMNTGDNQIIAVDLRLAFDPQVLEAQWIRNGALFPNILTSGVVDSGTASIALGATNTTTPVTGTGTVATVRFKAISATSTPTTVRFATDTFVGALGEGSVNALTTSTPSTITIKGSSQTTLTPTLTPTPQATESASPSAVLITSPKINDSVASTQQTFEGTAPPDTTVIITIYSDPITVTVVSDENGNWSYTLDEPLAAGPHTIVVAAHDPLTGVSNTATLAFVVVDNDENGLAQEAIPVSGVVENTIILLVIGIACIMTGSLLPVLERKKT